MGLLKWAAVSIAVLLAAFLLYLKWAFWEPAGFDQDSLAYKFKVASAVKEFPLWNPATDPKYIIAASDGPKPQTTVVRYTSKKSHEFLLKQLEALHFVCEQKTPSGLRICESSNEENQYVVSVWLEGQKSLNATPIEITFLGI